MTPGPAQTPGTQVGRFGSLRQFFLFVAVGVLNTVFGYGAYSLLVFLGLHYAIAALLGTCAGILFNFQTTGRIVFRNKDNRRLVRFTAAYALTYLLNLAGLRVLTGLGLNPYLAGAVLLAPMAIVAFLIQRRLVFHAGQPR